MITAAVGWLSTMALKGLGEYAGKLALVAAAGVMYFSWQTVQRHKGAEKYKVQIEKQGEMVNAQVRKNTERALTKPDDSMRRYVRPD